MNLHPRVETDQDRGLLSAAAALTEFAARGGLDLESGMDIPAAQGMIDALWESSVVPTLSKFIEIPSQSPLFDPEVCQLSASPHLLACLYTHIALLRWPD